MGCWPKFKTTKGESSRNQVNNLQSKVNVNEEYYKAFRTKSYIEMCGKVQEQVGTTNQERVSLVSSSFRTYSHLSKHILEPRQEILIDLIETSHLHQLLIDYFDRSLEGFRICGCLLQITDQMRTHHEIIKRVIKLSEWVSSDAQYKLIFNELAAYAKLDNPILVSNSVRLGVIQSQYRLMLDTLRKKHSKVKKIAKAIRICKKASAVGLVVASIGISIVTLVLAVHSLVGIVAAPVLLTAPVSFIKKVIKSTQTEQPLLRLGAQLDAAAKGVFFLNRDFQTLGQLIMWLHDEIDYSKSRAAMCMKNPTKQMLKELVKEFQTREARFLEKLEELEEHVYLCFLNINRFRRLVIEQEVEPRQRRS